MDLAQFPPRFAAGAPKPDRPRAQAQSQDVDVMTATPRPPRRPPLPVLSRAALARFGREQDGTLTVFGIYIAVLIMMLGGIAVDVMRSEQVRIAVQNVEDTAVLAATNLNQTLDAESVVKDYFAKAGMSQYLQSVSVTSSDSFKQVSAVATTDVPTLFMRLEGINTLNTVNNSTAEESIGDVEVALALDNSGSMTQQALAGYTTQCTTKSNKGVKYQSCNTVPVYTTKIAALITAASQFVDTMFAQTDPGTLTMSILPYDSHLDIGNELMADLNVTSTTDASPRKCVENSSLDFTTPAISTTASLVRVPYYDPGYSNTLGSPTPDCNNTASRDSVVFSDNPTTLKSLISSLQASGNTSIDTGVKWAAATLDPAFQPVVTKMIANGTLGAGYAGRPAAYSDRTNMKVLIVMSDGENTTRYDLNTAYRTGNSPVWYNSKMTGINAYSIYSASSGKYYSFYKSAWLAKPYGNNPASGCTTKNGTTTCTTPADTGYSATTPAAVNLTYPQLWANMSVSYYTSNIYGVAFGSSAGNTLYNNIISTTSSTTMDSNMSTICTAAKNAGIIIYSIGFQTTTHGAETLSDCATAPSYYFDAEGTEISSVFSKIANSIEHLRLTQ